MARYIRMNPVLGGSHEISERQALRKINSRWWVQHWDGHNQEFKNMWINTKDQHKDIIFKVEDEDFHKWERAWKARSERRGEQA